MLAKMPKPQAVGLCGKFVEVFWDGEASWFQAEVLSYDEQTRLHLVRYTEDGIECDELLSGPTNARLHGSERELSVWRHCIKTTSREALASEPATVHCASFRCRGCQQPLSKFEVHEAMLRCDGGCRRPFAELDVRWSCSSCDFDVCDACVQSRPAKRSRRR